VRHMKDKLYQIIANVMGIAQDSITEETGPANVPSWDSFNALMLVSDVESAFNIRLEMADVVAVKNVGDIIKVLEKYGVRDDKESQQVGV